MSFQFIEAPAVESLRSKHPDLLMVDVRDHANHSAQRLADSVCIPLAELADNKLFSAPANEHSADPSRPVLLICQLGKRAIMAAQALEGRIENPLFVLSGGLAACLEASVGLIQGGDG